MRTSTLFGTKNFGFFEFLVCPHGQGEGSIFRDFVRTSFMDGALPTIFLFAPTIFLFALLYSSKSFSGNIYEQKIPLMQLEKLQKLMPF